MNYGTLEHTCRPRDPLVARERERGKNRNKKTAKRLGDQKEMSERLIGQSKAPRVPAKHGFTSLWLIRDVKIKLQWWKLKNDG